MNVPEVDERNVAPTPYHCVCYTCTQERVEESIAAAESFYDYHSGQGHDVEIVRLHSEWPLEHNN